jgi:hypothetical protein
MTRQEENWILMTVLQIPWYHAEKIGDKADREFLLNKAKEVQDFMAQQQQQQQQAAQGMSSIITPDQM